MDSPLFVIEKILSYSGNALQGDGLEKAVLGMDTLRQS